MINIKPNFKWNQTLVSRIKETTRKLSENEVSYMVNESKKIAPVKSGYLKNNIISRRVNDYHYQFCSMAPYSLYVEFGTRYMPAQSFMRPVMNMTELTKLAIQRYHLAVVHSGVSITGEKLI